MDSVADVLESYLKPEDFDDIKQLDRAGIVDISVGIPWKHLTLAFMPSTLERLDRIEAAVKKIPKATDAIGVVAIEILDRFRAAALALGKTEDIRSLGAIFSRMTEIVEDHLGSKNEEAIVAPAAAEMANGSGPGAVATSVGRRRPRKSDAGEARG